MLIGTAVGPGGTYVAMGALVFIGVLTVVFLPSRGKPHVEVKRSVLGDVADGAKYVFRRPMLRLMLSLFVLTVILGFVFRILMPQYLVEHMGRPDTDLGMMMLVNGLAAAVVALTVAGFATSRWAWPVILVLNLRDGAGLHGAGGRRQLRGGAVRDGAAGARPARADHALAGADHDADRAGLTTGA